LWSEAVAYCAWRQRGGRLPTEDEWEAAARGPHGFRYPWGNRWERGRANADSLRDGFAPAGAGSPGRSWVGAVDLIGNAWEWTAAAASAYLADGLTEAIITSLGRIERLSVKSRNAVRRFRGAADDPATLGRALDVAYLVSGSVARPGRGQSPGVTVELLRASDGMHVWGGQYESRDTALQTIPQTVARAVATAITGALRP